MTTMFPELSAAIASAKAMKDTAKFLTDVSKSFDQAELKMRIVELVGQITELNQELQELRQKLSTRESVTYIDGVYWKNGAEHSGDPFCPKCLEADDKLIHMREHQHRATVFEEGFFTWECLSCAKEIRRNDKPTTPRVIPRAPSGV